MENNLKINLKESTTRKELTPPDSKVVKNLNVEITTPKHHKRIETLIKNCTYSSPTPTPLKIPASPMMKRLGFGTGVGVYLMERSPRATGECRSPWAIKKLSFNKEGSSVYKDRLEYESKILKELKHPNIIGYRAVIDTTFVLAMEKASNSLNDLIEKRLEFFDHENTVENDVFPEPFPVPNIEKVALDVSKALDYLHNEKKLIHGDLKSGNILVFEDFNTVKLCDFGVARRIKEDGTIEGQYVGTEIWQPMEVYSQQDETQPITSKADIYPLGLTIYEMISLKAPHLPPENAFSEDDSEAGSFDESGFEIYLSENIGTRPPLPDIDFNEDFNRVLELFYICTDEDASKRPTAQQIIKLLSDC